MAEAIDMEAAQGRLEAKRRELGIRPPTHMRRIGSVCVDSAKHSLPDSPVPAGPPVRREGRGFWGRAAELSRLMRQAGVMPEHAAATLADFPAPIVEDLRAAWDGRGVLLTGRVGGGKTHLAAALVRRHVLAGVSVQFVLARDLFMLIRDTYRDNAERTELHVLREFSGIDLLVIDDLGKEGSITPQVLSVLHVILSKRIGHDLRTVITTNLSLREIGAEYDPAIESRLATFGVVVLDGADRRRA